MADRHSPPAEAAEPVSVLPPGRWRAAPMALALFGTGLLLTAAVAGNLRPPNPLGTPGAWLGGQLRDALGAAVFVLLAGWLVLSAQLLRAAGPVARSARLVGWLLLLLCGTVAADRWEEMASAGWIGPAPAEGGGLLGAALAGWLASRFWPVGQACLFAGGTILGLTLAMDGIFLRLLRAGWFLTRKALRLGWWTLRGVAGRSLRLFAVHRPPRLVERAAPRPTAEANAFSLAGGGVPIVRTLAFSDEPADAHGLPDDFALPPLDLLDDPQPFPHAAHDHLLRERAALLEKTFLDFGLKVRVAGIHTGPVITQYEVALETGLRVNKVTALADDLALNLKVPGVRIAPVPGKNTIGIEVPNEHRAVVRLKELLTTTAARVARMKLPLLLGKDAEGRPLLYDLAEMPHLLIAGTTGTGKSVCLNTLILSLLLTRRPDEVQMLMIDPKMLELSEYGPVPHLMYPVVKDMKKAEALLAWAVDKMEERYELLSRARVRNIAGYNALSYAEVVRRVRPADEEERKQIPERMAYIVVVVDEFNDLMMQLKKEVEGHIIRLAQKARAAGIHLVLATQKPTVDVITGLIKSNLPARICFKVASRTDSRVVLDEMGADKLLGKGDMLFLPPGTSALVRAQGAYASDEEIGRVVAHLEAGPAFVTEQVELVTRAAAGPGGLLEHLRGRDPLYEQAIELVVREGRGSVSLLQRALGVGYGRAARLIDFMAEDGIVGHYNGSQAREVLYSPEQWRDAKETGAARADGAA